MSMESHGGMILTGETEELGGKTVPAPFYSPQMYSKVKQSLYTPWRCLGGEEV
jgi:hypothetical protein